MLTTANKPGALFKVLSRFSALGINLTSIISRPIEGRDFEFRFFLDFETQVYSDRFAELMSHNRRLLRGILLPRQLQQNVNKHWSILMKNEKERRKVIKELLDVTDKEFTDEELIHQLIATEVTKNTDKDEKLSLGQKASDAVAKFAGSWAFIFSFIAVMVIWMVVNIVLAANAFDGYPFILLNLVLSCIAAVQAPLIMMSQNRQEAKDRKRAENDYRINLKNELIIDDLHKKLDLVLENQKKIMRKLEILEEEKQKPDGMN